MRGPQSIKSQGYRKVGDLTANSEQILLSLLLEKTSENVLGKERNLPKGVHI